MPQSRLKLRSWPMVALAYVLGPLIGWTAWITAVLLPDIYKPGFSSENATTAWIVTMILGSVACLVIELVIVTPLLLAFSRNRWPWLNGWSTAVIGFLLGAVPWLLLVAPTPTRSPDQMPGGLTACTHGRCTVEGWAQAGLGSGPIPNSARQIWEIDGHWTLAGWAHVAHEAALMGMVGLIAAIVFRIVAVRTAETSEA